jgi:hypothetical protein
MNSPHDHDEQLRLREQELQEREYALRLREMEAELHQPPISPTVKQAPTGSKLQGKYRQLLNVMTFLGLVVAVAVAVRIATQVATAIMVGGIAWIAYQIFVQSKRSKP